MDLTTAITITTITALLLTAVSAGVYKGKVEIRPFRLSAIAMTVALIVLVWMGLNHDYNLMALGMDQTGNLIVNLVLDVSVFMVAITGIVTSMVKLSDDGGESDSVTVTRMFLADQ